MTLALYAFDAEHEQLIAEVPEGSAFVGRNPEKCQVIVLNKVVSTIHGEVFFFAGQWFFKDLGSTNGSNINGVPLKSDQPYTIRSGDLLGLASVQLLVKYQPSFQNRRAIVVFKQWEPVAIKRAPEYGLVLSLGGVNSEYALKHHFANDPVISIESLGQDLKLNIGNFDTKIFVNNEQVSGACILKDRDLIEVHDYSLLVDCPEEAASDESGAPGFKNLRTWENSKNDLVDPMEGKAHLVKHSKFGSDSGTAADDDYDIHTHPTEVIKVANIGKKQLGIGLDKGFILITIIVAAILSLVLLVYFFI